MRPYIIRKCKKCQLWHIFTINLIGDMIQPIVIASFAEWWDDGIMLINFPELYMSVD